VRYNCVLSVPVLESLNVAPTNYFVTSLQDTNANLTNITNYQPLLAAASGLDAVNVNGIGVVNTVGSIVPPPGNYLWFFLSQAACTAQELTIFQVTMNKDGNQQGPLYEVRSNAILAQQLSISCNGFISCNGTDAITFSLYAAFASGTTTATSVFTLVAI